MSHKDTTGERGRQAEAMAGQFLERQGLRILSRNYRCRGGEIDLVCREGNVLVFVEVRLRCSAAWGGAAASITRTKQRRVLLAAQHYLNEHRLNQNDCRIDCVLLDTLADDAIQWIRHAFSAD